MKKYILEAKNISKSFGNVKALEDVNFYLQKGKIHGLLGENGAGKSSLMNILSGIYQPEKGSIYISDTKQKNLDPESASELGIGMVHQEFRLIESFSIQDNLTLSKANIYQDNFKEAYDKYSEIFSLSVNPEKKIVQLSVGEKQKIEIMKLIFKNSNIMLLDEPSLGLSPKLVKEIFEIIIRINKELKTTILLVEQNANIALSNSDFGYVLELGRIVMEGNSKELLEKEDIKEFYLGQQDEGIRGERRWKKKKMWR